MFFQRAEYALNRYVGLISTLVVNATPEDLISGKNCKVMWSVLACLLIKKIENS